MPGPLTQLLELQTGPADPVPPVRRVRVRVRIPGTLVGWLAIPALWALAMIALSLSVRF